MLQLGGRWWLLKQERGTNFWHIVMLTKVHCYANKSTPQLFLKVLAHRVKKAVIKCFRSFLSSVLVPGFLFCLQGLSQHSWFNTASKIPHNAEVKPFVAAALLCQKSTNYFSLYI